MNSDQTKSINLVDSWAEQLGVSVSRVQVRAMRNKWGSISTAGTLTLADDRPHVTT